MVSILVNYVTYISMERKLKITNMKSNVRLTQLNCNYFMSARRKRKYNSPSSPATLIINKDNRATKKQNFEKEAMVKTNLVAR